MPVYACVTARSRAGTGTVVAVYIITVIIVVVLLKAGYSLPTSIIITGAAACTPITAVAWAPRIRIAR